MLTQEDLQWLFGTASMGTRTNKVTRYPLTNIGMMGEEKIAIKIACAGFKKDEIDLELKGNQLIITGTKDTEDTEDFEPEINWIQEHISSDNFERILTLSENYVGGDIEAEMEDGIIDITITPKEPTRKLIQLK